MLGIDTKEVDDELLRYGIKIAERIENVHHVDKDDYENRGTTDPQIDLVCIDLHKRGKPISANKVIDEINFLLRTRVAEFDCGATKQRIFDRLAVLRANGQISDAMKAGRPPAPISAPQPAPVQVQKEPQPIEVIKVTDWQDEFVQEERALNALTKDAAASLATENWLPDGKPSYLIHSATASPRNNGLAIVWQ